ncbi:MAG: hypothetical protein M1445_11620 [Bacteroidetes bacterium]|nr:hypothetical protein [Bacteroidota bacterium]MCL6101600.1 hypothetical protein [Bacteroidota bacterium]
MENFNDFTPKMIGQPDLVNRQRINKLYTDLAEKLQQIRFGYEDILQVNLISLEDLLNVLKMKSADFELFLKRTHIAAAELKFPGLSVEKLIEIDAVEIPKEISLIVEVHKEIIELVNLIRETHFVFPISRLFDFEDTSHALSDDFKKALEEYTVSFTENENQNEAVLAVEKFCEALNDLIELKIIKKEGGLWQGVGQSLAFSVENQKGSDRPLHPDRKMFRRPPFNRFHSGERFLYAETKREDILY